MSDDKEHAERRPSEFSEDSAPSNPATQISDSTIQSSQADERPSTSAASTSTAVPSTSRTCSPSRYSILRRKVSSFFKNWKSKKDANVTESPRKSKKGVNVAETPKKSKKDAVVTETPKKFADVTESPRKSKKDASVTETPKKFKKGADVTESPRKSGLSVIGFVSSAVDSLRSSPDRTSLVDAERESPPPSVKQKPEKEYYWQIDTFVDREKKPRTSGNLTDTTSLSTSDGLTSPSTNEEPSSAEDSSLIKEEKPSKDDEPSL